MSGNDTKENKFISLVVYMHNEEQYITAFLDKIVSFCSGKFAKLELICINDDCQDETLAKLREYQDAHPLNIPLSIIQMGFYHGLEASMNAGRDLSIGDIVYEFDHMKIDYETELLLEMYEHLLKGADIVTAGKNSKTSLSSRLFYALYNRTTRTNKKIGPETIQIISRRGINRVKSVGQYIPYRKAVYRNSGLQTKMISYQPICRLPADKTKSRRMERTSLALDSLIYFTNALERASLILSCLFLLITLGVGGVIIYDFFSTNSRPVEGWVSMMGFMSFGFMGVFSLLTIILKYLTVMINLVFKKQRYLIENIEKW